MLGSQLHNTSLTASPDIIISPVLFEPDVVIPHEPTTFSEVTPKVLNYEASILSDPSIYQNVTSIQNVTSHSQCEE